MNKFMILLTTILLTVCTYSPIVADHADFDSGSVIIIMDKTTITLDPKTDGGLNLYEQEGENRVIVTNKEGKVILDHTFTENVLNLSGQKLNDSAYSVTLIAGNCSKVVYLGR